jgi:hypothetical protein
MNIINDVSQLFYNLRFKMFYDDLLITIIRHAREKNKKF